MPCAAYLYDKKSIFQAFPSPSVKDVKAAFKAFRDIFKEVDEIVYIVFKNFCLELFISWNRFSE